MEIVAGIFVVGLVIVIGAVLVIREAGRLARNPPGALFDAEDAFEWVVERLPDDVAATLTADDVRRILDLQIEFFQQAEVPTGNGDGHGGEAPVVVGSGDQIQYILERAAASGEPYLPEQVDAVVETQLAYLRNIGAVGPEARDDDP